MTNQEHDKQELLAKLQDPNLLASPNEQIMKLLAFQFVENCGYFGNYEKMDNQECTYYNSFIFGYLYACGVKPSSDNIADLLAAIQQAHDAGLGKVAEQTLLEMLGPSDGEHVVSMSQLEFEGE